jgi:hypothetical protein
MPDIAPVKGLIELTDNFTSELGLAEAALGNFTKTNQESLKAVAGAAGLITAAIGGITVAAIELGKRGADVNDVNATLEHFAGSAKEAQADMDALRQGVKGTVDNFALAKDAAGLLSAGVKLTTQDFSTLGQAAFVLQNRGLGPTKDQLDLVSEALTTGRTRALAMKLGVIDTGNAQEDYAKKLGVTVDKLSDAGKAEANRIAVMKILKSAVADAGEQERDFGEEFEASGAAIQNWIDDLGSAIASSKVFGAGFKAVEAAVSSAFGAGNQDAIKKVTTFLEQGAIQLVNFGQVAITGARVVEGAFEGIKTVILGVITAAAGIADGLVETLTIVATAAAKISAPFSNPDNDPLVSYLKTTRTELRAMTVDLATQTAEAAKATVGHTEFDKTLDGLSTTLDGISKAMSTASTATTSNAEANSAAEGNAKKLADANKQLAQSMVDQEKITKELEKSTTELAAIWSKYYAQVAADSGTTLDKQKADIQAWLDEQIKGLDKLDPLFQQKYDAYQKIAAEKLHGITSDWDSVRDESIEGMQQMADKALQTYEDMLTSSDHFTREALDKQLQKYHDLQDRVRGYGVAGVQAVGDVKDKVTILDSAWDAVGRAVDDNNVKVRMLDGEVVSVAEALKRLNDGGSYEVSSANFADALKFYETGPGAKAPNYDPTSLAKQGYSFAEIVRYAFGPRPSGPLPPPTGPRIPGFAEGGTVMVGENGPEVLRVPFGSQIYPTGTPSSVYNNPMMGSPSTILNFHVNGTAEQSAKKIKDIILNELRLRKQF